MVMKLSEELTWRGFLAQNTLDDIGDLDEGSRKFYWGCDPSSDSLTVGNLAAAMMCKCFIRHGYEPTLLVGGATGRIGDPKESEERTLKSVEEVEKNVKGIVGQYNAILGADVPVVNNYDWFKDIGYLDFLREVGKQFSMTQLLDREFVRARIGEGGSGLSYAEFSYSLIQGYDFLHLYRIRGINLQLCGADQFGNCVSGMHLIKRLEGARADVWSCPLVIDRISGKKFGKSEGNAVWLSAEKTSPFAFYQFWLNVGDDGVEEYLKIYTELNREEIEVILAEQAENPGARAAQKRLALEVTKLVHGAGVTENVVRATEVLFRGGELTKEIIKILEKELPVVSVGVDVIDALVGTGLASSKGEARRLVEGGAVSLGEVKVAENQKISEMTVIRKGKNQFALVR